MKQTTLLYIISIKFPYKFHSHALFMIIFLQNDFQILQTS